MKVTRTSIAHAVIGVLESGARKATVYLDENTVVKATSQRKPTRRSRTRTLILTVGAPNFEERKFIKLCKKAGEPVRRTQYKWYR